MGGRFVSIEKIVIEREYIKILWFLILVIVVYLFFDKLLFLFVIEVFFFL